MAQTKPVLTQTPYEPVLAVDDEIPTVDYFMLFSDDPDQRSKALQHLSKACDEFGFFYVWNTSKLSLSDCSSVYHLFVNLIL